MQIRTWKQLLNDPRVVSVWTEANDGTDYWVVLKDEWVTDEGGSFIHEWSKRECILELNHVRKRTELDG